MCVIGNEKWVLGSVEGKDVNMTKIGKEIKKVGEKKKRGRL